MDNPPKDTNDQAELFNILKDKYVLTFDFPSETSADYYHVGNVNNIDYFAPNDEDWGCLIAVDYDHKLAVDTCHFEMHDIEGSPEDYAFYFRDGYLQEGFFTKKLNEYYSKYPEESEE